ncbi:stage V sporulation protein D [Clostridium oryzae]|uniref:Stage V sporulation protein D n=1 Tax=Clostridium oryzae TaxID=1450648 RepID=A0A1V4IT84_9CLOT|nr:stage V sporulation protein D [Clostridium oryzae]OPJ63241.1 stage V sporulation protein D [Clostridium oryzae]
MYRKIYRDKVIMKKRIIISLIIIFMLFMGLLTRLAYVMIFQWNKLNGFATEQWTNEVKIDARRGKILDRNGNELAVSANVYRVDLDMNSVRAAVRKSKGKITFEKIAEGLSAALNKDKLKILQELYKKLPNGKDRGAATLARRVDKETADKVRALKINGVLISPDTKRYYPNNNFLSHVIGTTNSDGNGLAGVELQYNKELSGIPGLKISEIDRRNDAVPYEISDFTKPIPGKDVVLTIDKKIQVAAEKSAEQALIDNKAKAVTIMVMNPKNGEILALVNKPDFDPNNPREGASTPDEMAARWRNRAVSDTYEPGSIFKVVTAIAAMEKNLVNEKDTFVCNGSLTVGKKHIHCWKRTGHGSQSFIQILENSCNVGFMTLGERLKAKGINEYITKFGFGKKTGIDLPGEAKGIVKKTSAITSTDLATISFGQTNTLTPIQYMAAFNTIANNGVWITPHIMKEIVHESSGGNYIVDSTYENYTKNYAKKQIVSKEKANLLCSYLEKVISKGGGKKAYIAGYDIAGKTGTAQKVNPKTGAYESGKYVASFAGMAPSKNPKVTVFVSIDQPDPSNYYAGQIATPVAKQVFYDIFNYYSIKGDANPDESAQSLLNDVVLPEIRNTKKSEALKKLKDLNIEYEIHGSGEYITDMNPKPGYTVKEGTKINLYTGSEKSDDDEYIIVPDFTGLNQKKAKELLTSLKIKGNFAGSGLVGEQSVAAGSKLKENSYIELELENLGND